MEDFLQNDIGMVVGESCVILGDFNSRHKKWESGKGNRGKGRKLVDWQEEEGMELQTRKERITRKQGDQESVLDLIWTRKVDWKHKEPEWNTLDHALIMGEWKPKTNKTEGQVIHHWIISEERMMEKLKG